MRATMGRNAKAFVLRKRRAFTLAELIADGIVHGVGLLVALIAGTVLLTVAIMQTATSEVAALAIYVTSFVVLLTVSMAFNLCPPGPLKP